MTSGSSEGAQEQPTAARTREEQVKELAGSLDLPCHDAHTEYADAHILEAERRGYDQRVAEEKGDAEDMANVGRALMEKIEEACQEGAVLHGWAPSDCPSEIVTDLCNRVEEEKDAGANVVLDELCDRLGVSKTDVSWDAATETWEGDVRSVCGNIIHAAFGEDEDPIEICRAARSAPQPDTRDETIREQAAEIERLRCGLSKCAEYVGAYASPSASVEFLVELVPEEVKLAFAAMATEGEKT